MIFRRASRIDHEKDSAMISRHAPALMAISLALSVGGSSAHAAGEAPALAGLVAVQPTALDLRHARQLLADLQAGHVGVDRGVFAADFFARFGLRIEAVVV